MPSRADRQREAMATRGYDRAIGRAEDVGSDLLTSFSSGIQSFNPQAILEQRLASAHADFKKRLGRDIESMRARQVAGGRLDTGFATQDTDRLFERSAEDLNLLTGRFAAEAGNQDLRRLSLMGATGAGLTRDVVAERGSEAATLRHQRYQDQADRRNAIGSLLAAGLGAAGTVFGGPLGPAIFGIGKAVT